MIIQLTGIVYYYKARCTEVWLINAPVSFFKTFSSEVSWCSSLSIKHSFYCLGNSTQAYKNYNWQKLWGIVNILDNRINTYWKDRLKPSRYSFVGINIKFYGY